MLIHNLSNNILNVEALSEGDNLSDHIPVKLKLFYDMPKIYKHNLFLNNEVKFNLPDSLPLDKLNYKTIIKTFLSQVDIPIDIILCCDNHCKFQYEQYRILHTNIHT